MNRIDTSTEAIAALNQCLQTLGRDMDRHAAPDWDEHENVFLAVNTIDALAAERDTLRAEVERLRATPPEVTALVEAATALRDQIARWHEGGPAAGPEESRALFEALDDALAKWEAAQK